MKTFVLATDFSEAANQAADVAMHLATAQGASLVLMHAFHFWPDNPAESGFDFPLSRTAMFDDSERRLRQLANELQARYGTAVPIRHRTREGHTLASIHAVVYEEQADLLIMSTAGSAPQSAQLLGSVATDLIADIEVPLLLIPPGAHLSAVTNVVMGVDLITPPDVLAMETALRFARQVGCVVNVLCVDPLPASAGRHEQAELIRRLMGTVPHTLTLLSGDDVCEVLLAFAHEQKADLIVMMPQAHNWLSRLLTDTRTERLARLTDIPLLAIG
ncbi:hypothetical protein GCM10027578_00180 [Spirosoma luteolum]